MTSTTTQNSPRLAGHRGYPAAILDLDFRVQYWDADIERQCGVDATAAVGRLLNELLVPLGETTPDWDCIRNSPRWTGLAALVVDNGCVPSPVVAQISRRADDKGFNLRISQPDSIAPTQPLGSPGDAQQSAADARFALLLRYLPGFCYAVNRELVFTASNGAGLSVLHLADGQVVGMKVTDLWGTCDPTYEPLACHLKALAGIPQAYQDVCMGRSLEYKLEPIWDTDGRITGVAGFALDVTERQKAKNDLARLMAQLHQAQKVEAIGQLAGSVAHDFNNLLTCVMANLSFASKLTGTDETLRRHLAEANAAVESATKLARQLLAFGRKRAVAPRPVDVGRLIERMRGILVRLAGELVTLTVDYAPNLGAVRADPGQLEQVLVNLVVNARDAVEGSGWVHLETSNVEFIEAQSGTPDSLSPGAYVRLRVTDSGHGMSSTVRARLFEPFFTTKEGGTGLGLSTVLTAVSQNGGSITVDSTLGKGSTFSVYLPLHKRHAEPEPEYTDTPSERCEHLIGGSETILLVEDDAVLLDVANCTLQQLGYEVMACSDPDEALRLSETRTESIDLLVTDIMLPRMNGLDLASRLTKLRPGISVLFTPGSGESIIKQGRIERGESVLLKPYRPSELAGTVRSLLDQRKSVRTESK